VAKQRGTNGHGISIPLLCVIRKEDIRGESSMAFASQGSEYWLLTGEMRGRGRAKKESMSVHSHKPGRN